MASVAASTPSVWIPDEKATACAICSAVFGVINRRHHCRSCGKIFCGQCCYQFQSLPSYLPSTHKRYCDGKKHRVCNMCLRDIIFIKKNKSLILIFSYIPLPMTEIFSLRTVCKKWLSAVDTIIGVFKSIHLKIGYQKWTSMERRLIYIHWREFTGHSRLMIQSIRAMNGILDVGDMVRHYKDTDPHYPCMFCSDRCSKDIHVFDIIDCMCCFPGQQILESQEMEAWIGVAISRMDREWLHVLIPWLLQVGVSAPVQRILANSVIPVVADNIRMAYRFYFTCSFLITGEHSIFYTSIMNRLLHATPFKDDIQKSHDFLCKIKYPQNITDYDFNNIRMPYDPEITIRDVHCVNIVQLSTFTQPWIIPIETHEKGIVRILLKHDDLRKDQIVMDIIQMMKRVTDIHLEQYAVLPIDTGYGIIEMLPDASTLQEINRDTTLTNWIVKNNITKSMLQIRNDFVLSCASNCILSFMLGVGDRNQGNILVSKKGTFSHIDFSYILGTDPKWAQMTEMRITPGMVDLLGGNTSDQFQDLIHQCNSIFSDIKKYTYFWYALFRLLASADPPIEPHYRRFDSIELHVEERLMPRMSVEQVRVTIADIVEKNSGSRVAGWVDTFHTFKSSVETLLFHMDIT